MDSNQLLSCITVNLRAVREQIARAADGREVALICVTKYAEDEWIRALVAAGATDLAEVVTAAPPGRLTHTINQAPTTNVTYVTSTAHT